MAFDTHHWYGVLLSTTDVKLCNTGGRGTGGGFCDNRATHKTKEAERNELGES